METTLIYGIRNAAKYLGCGERTVYRAIEREEFPAAEIELPQTGQVQRAWTASTLDEYRPKLRKPGNPQFQAKEKGVPK